MKSFVALLSLLILFSATVLKPAEAQSPTASTSLSASTSFSPSISVSASTSLSPSASISHSPSISLSPSSSISHSPSASISHSPSISTSPTISHSASTTPSVSITASPSPSAVPVPECPTFLDGIQEFSLSVLGTTRVTQPQAQLTNVQLAGELFVNGNIQTSSSNIAVGLPCPANRSSEVTAIVTGQASFVNTQIACGSLFISAAENVTSAPFFRQAQLGATTLSGNLTEVTGLDVEEILEFFTNLQSNFCASASTPAQISSTGAITFTAAETAEETQIFSVSAQALNNARSVSFNGFSSAPNTNVIITVQGNQTVNFTNAGIALNGLFPSGILWVFCASQPVSISSVQFLGSLLTLDSLTLTNVDLRGAVIANSISASSASLFGVPACF